MMKEANASQNVGGVESTYDSSSEPWFVSDIYFPLFAVVYAFLLIFYLVRWWKTIRTETISEQSLNHLVNLVFIPIFIFAITFKAINIQVLAWFTPYFALRKKIGMMIEYSVLTVLHGLFLIFTFAGSNPAFEEFMTTAAKPGTFIYYLIIVPAIWLAYKIPRIVWVSLTFCTIIWYQVRAIIELTLCSRDLLSSYALLQQPSDLIEANSSLEEADDLFLESSNGG